MLANIRDIKKAIREEMAIVEKVTVQIEEFGTGNNTYVAVYFNDGGFRHSKHYTTAEEESLAAARRRFKRFQESMKDYNVIMEGEF